MWCLEIPTGARDSQTAQVQFLLLLSVVAMQRDRSPFERLDDSPAASMLVCVWSLSSQARSDRIGHTSHQPRIKKQQHTLFLLMQVGMKGMSL